MNYRQATEEDIPEIVSLHQSLRRDPKTLTEKDGQKGFLITELAPDKLSRILSLPSNNVILATNNSSLEGYTIGYGLGDFKRLDSGWYRLLSGMVRLVGLPPGKMHYHEYIACLNGGGGIGGALLKKQLAHFRGEEYVGSICEILHSPVTNNASLSFHIKQGFRGLGELPHQYGGADLRWGIYLKTFSS